MELPQLSKLMTGVRFPLPAHQRKELTSTRFFPLAKHAQGKSNSGGGRGTTIGSPCRESFKTEGFEKRVE